MDTLILEDFRCFAERHEVPIRPLTLLVGENSTGKTSFLAAVRVAYDLRWYPAEMRFLEGFGTPDFNEEPFNLGSYDQIANYRAGPTGRSQSFVIGQKFTVERSTKRPRNRKANRKSKMEVRARFVASKSQPFRSEFRASSDKHEIAITNNDDDQSPLLSFSTNDRIAFERRFDSNAFTGNTIFELFAMRQAAEETDSGLTPAERKKLFQIMDSVLLGREPRPYAFAPLRMKPQRTYDPIKEIRDPEGSHIPMLLARMLGPEGSPDFKVQMKSFGVISGLYSDIRIRRLGRKNDPFQIEVKIPSIGTWRNFIDVGYGVSQAIPIIADAVSTAHGATLLIQQPEVHLHPRAQAAMGSSFADLAASGRNRLVVETHSDHLVDRVRMDVRDERIKASDVVILYFEQGRHGVDIHPIEIDARGHPVEVPPGYRSFFLEEDRRFFGVGP